MRSLSLSASTIVILAAFASAVACTQPLPVDGSSTSQGVSGSTAKASTSKSAKSSTPASADSANGDDDDATGAANSGGPTFSANQGSSSDDDDDATSTGSGTAPAYPCTGAGLAAYADALVNAGRKECTSDGVGVVKNDNYQCVQTAISDANTPHPNTAYKIVTTLLAPNQQFPDLECTYFVQMVTAGVCGTPLSPTDRAWTDYPYACEFINKAPAGWTWFDNSGNSDDVQLGDIFVYNSSDGCNQDPGHIMVVAELKGGGKFRIAEANELNSNGTEADEETGVMSNSRITSLNDSQSPAGWMRLNAN